MFTYLLFLIVFAVCTAFERRTLKYTEAVNCAEVFDCCRVIVCDVASEDIVHLQKYQIYVL